MALFKKKADPISERAKSLNAEIAQLEAKIKALSDETARANTGPRIRSTAVPGHAPAPAPALATPVFVEVQHKPALLPMVQSTEPLVYNHLGARKFNPGAAWRRLCSHFRGAGTTNPRLVNYLAAGSVHGLQPLRIEKRVARNRTLLLIAVLVAVIWGVLYLLVAGRG